MKIVPTLRGYVDTASRAMIAGKWTSHFVRITREN